MAAKKKKKSSNKGPGSDFGSLGQNLKSPQKTGPTKSQQQASRILFGPQNSNIQEMGVGGYKTAIVRALTAFSKSKVKPNTIANKISQPPQPPWFVGGKQTPTNWNPISRAPGQQIPGRGQPKMTTKQLDAYRERMGFNKTPNPAPAKRGKGTGRSSGRPPKK